MEHAAPTPIDIAVEAQVFLRAPSLPGLPHLSLFFNLDEVTETVQSYKRQFKPHYTLSVAAVKALLDTSQGHAGLVISALNVVYEAHQAKRRETEHSERRVTSEITLQNFREYTSDISTLLIKLDPRNMHHSFVRVKWGYPRSCRDLIMQILVDGPVLYDSQNEAHRFLYTSGICQGQLELVSFDPDQPNKLLNIINIDVTKLRDHNFNNPVWLSESTMAAARTVLVFPTQVHA